MGVFQDGIAHIHNMFKKNRYTFSKEHKILRYVFLGILVVAMIFRGLETFKIFDLVYILSSGNSATATMSVFARKHLVDYADVGFGSAAATALLFFIAFLSIFYISFNRKKLNKLS